MKLNNAFIVLAIFLFVSCGKTISQNTYNASAPVDYPFSPSNITPNSTTSLTDLSNSMPTIYSDFSAVKDPGTTSSIFTLSNAAHFSLSDAPPASNSLFSNLAQLDVTFKNIGVGLSKIIGLTTGSDCTAAWSTGGTAIGPDFNNLYTQLYNFLNTFSSGPGINGMTLQTIAQSINGVPFTQQYVDDTNSNVYIDIASQNNGSPQQIIQFASFPGTFTTTDASSNPVTLTYSQAEASMLQDLVHNILFFNFSINGNQTNTTSSALMYSFVFKNDILLDATAKVITFNLTAAVTDYTSDPNGTPVIMQGILKLDESTAGSPSITFNGTVPSNNGAISVNFNSGICTVVSNTF